MFSTQRLQNNVDHSHVTHSDSITFALILSSQTHPRTLHLCHTQTCFFLCSEGLRWSPSRPPMCSHRASSSCVVRATVAFVWMRAALRPWPNSLPTFLSTPSTLRDGAPRVRGHEISLLFALGSHGAHAGLNPRVVTEETAEWIFVVDTLNFCFWSAEGVPLYGCEYEGQVYTGYWSLCAAINRAMQEGVPVLSASFLASVTEQQLARIFRSCTATSVPLLVERVRVLNEAGRVLMERFEGKFQNVVKQSKGSAQELVKLMTQHFPSYRDVCSYGGRQVAFLKRAQILVADLWAAYEGVGLGAFHDVDCVTMFADYRVPQVLVLLGILRYDDAVTQRLRANPHLESGCELECEIRAASIWAVEKLKRELQSRHSRNVNSIQLDFYLWGLAKSKMSEMQSIPFHKTRHVYY